MRLICIQSLVLLGFVAIAPPASAQDPYERFHDPWRIYLGGFWPTTNSELSINAEGLPPIPPLNVEDVLRVEDSKGAAWGGIAWNFARRHEVEFEHFALDREGGVAGTFTPPIHVGNTFIEAGAVNTIYNTSLTRLTYGFYVKRTERANFRLMGGFHIAKLEAGLGLAGLICDPTTTPTAPPGCPAAGTATKSEDVTAPLPHFGASFSYIFTPTLAINLQALGFAIELDSIDGSIIELDADLAWQPWRNFGLGVGARYFNTDVKAGSAKLNGEFKFEYLGPTAYVHFTF